MDHLTFVGREAELAILNERLSAIGKTRGDVGKAVIMRGRRRVGKSRLVTEFITRSGLPSYYFQASRYAPPASQFEAMMQALATSSLPGASLGTGAQPSSLSAALRQIGAAVDLQKPTIIVLDELPWLLEGIAGGAGELQRVWDHELSKKPVLLLLLGSDITMMEQLTAYDQPFYGRGREMVLLEMSPKDIAQWTGLAGADAFDAYLLTGGQPLVAEDWAVGMGMDDFLQASFATPVSALATEGLRILDTEFPPDTNARAVLTAIGGRGERTFTGIAQSLAGRLSQPTLVGSLEASAARRIITADEPLSTRSGARDRRWRIADPALRFWLAFVEPSLSDIDRGRPDLALNRFRTGYPAWRGRAIEPVVRQSLWRLLPDTPWPNSREVGGWWPRTNTPELDLVGADGRPASNIDFVGTIKWRPDLAITSHDVDRLVETATAVPGATKDTPLVAVSAGGGSDPRLAAVWTADHLLSAW